MRVKGVKVGYDVSMEEQMQIPRSEILVDNRVIPLASCPSVPEEAYPPVIKGVHPLMIVDDFALDLSGGDGPLGYSGTWVLRDGHLFLRWYLGWSHVKWDVRADWYTGDLDLQEGGGHHYIHLDHGCLAVDAAA